MALSIVGTATTSQAATITLPTHAIGDIIVIFGYRGGNNTISTKPTAAGTVPTWVDIDVQTGANTNSARTAYAIATATNHTSGSWTGLTDMICVVLRGQAASPIGGHNENGTTGTVPTSSAVTMSDASGASMLLHFYGGRNITSWAVAPAGYTRQATTNTSGICAAFNTKDVTTSDSAAGQGTQTSTGYRTATVEILADVPPPAGTPAFRSAGTVLAGSSSTTASVPVPAGVAANDIVMVFFYVETTQAITAPAGFTEDTNSPATVTGASAHNQRVFWKRATGADSGTYAFTIAAGLAWRQAGAVAYSGCITSGNPFDFTNSAIKTTTTTGATPAVSGTTLGANRLLVFGATEFNFSVLTPPSGFTKRFEYAADNAVVAADKVQAAAGATGSLTGTFAGNNATSAWLGALIPAATGRDASGDFFAMM